jgi:HAMP domain-containing protein
MESPRKDAIVLDNERICGFFDAHPYVDPTRFMLSCIKNFEQKMYSDETTHVIKHDSLQSLKREFQALVCQKEHSIKILKAFYREQLQLMENVQLPTLEVYLKSKFDEEELGPQFANLFECPDCTRASFPSKKALAVHRRYCEKNSNDLTPLPIVVSTEHDTSQDL